MQTAIILTVLAGLSTAIGGAAVFFTKHTNKKFIATALGFSAGVMIFVSLVEILGKSRDAFGALYGDQIGFWYTMLAFFGGVAVIAVIDRLIPSPINPHELTDRSDGKKVALKPQLMRAGLITALAIGIHNVPEGLVTFLGALEDPLLGVALAVAIAIHNIPEGVAVAVPIYYATGSKWKGFGWSLVSGILEPVGAIVGYLLLSQRIGDGLYGILFGAVAGIMIFISFDELLPSAQKYGHHHLTTYGLIAGMAVMAVSLGLFL